MPSAPQVKGADVVVLMNGLVVEAAVVVTVVDGVVVEEDPDEIKLIISIQINSISFYLNSWQFQV